MKEEALFNAWHSNVLIIGTQGNPDFAIPVQEIAIFHAAIDQQAGCATAEPPPTRYGSRPGPRAGDDSTAGRKFTPSSHVVREVSPGPTAMLLPGAAIPES